MACFASPAPDASPALTVDVSQLAEQFGRVESRQETLMEQMERVESHQLTLLHNQTVSMDRIGELMKMMMQSPGEPQEGAREPQEESTDEQEERRKVQDERMEPPSPSVSGTLVPYDAGRAEAGPEPMKRLCRKDVLTWSSI